jgi:hypothetical protein
MSGRGLATSPAAAAALLDALSAIEEDQLPAGEIVSCAPGADGRLAYRRSLAASIAVHEALACLDPRSASEETRSVRAFLAPEATSRLCLGAARVRRRIRAFLAWQELPGHLWREDGRQGEKPADPALSAAAAAAVMDDPARAAGRWSLYARALGRFGAAGGPGRRLAVAAASPAGPPGADLVVAATMAGFLALAGEDAQPLIASVEREVERLASEPGAAFPLAAACAVARWWERAHLPGRQRLATALAPCLLARVRNAAAGTDADAADAARALGALVDLEAASPEVAVAARRLLAGLPHTAGWTTAGAAAGVVRCPALTRALVVAAVVRSHALAEEVAPCTAMAS